MSAESINFGNTIQAVDFRKEFQSIKEKFDLLGQESIDKFIDWALGQYAKHHPYSTKSPEIEDYWERMTGYTKSISIRSRDGITEQEGFWKKVAAIGAYTQFAANLDSFERDYEKVTAFTPPKFVEGIDLLPNGSLVIDNVGPQTSTEAAC